MYDLAESPLRVLHAIVDAPIAWQTPEQIADRLGLDIDAATDTLADLDVAGWLDPWELSGAVHVTLSPHAAARLGVRLEPVGRSEAVRWLPIDEPEHQPRTWGRAIGNAELLDRIADPTPGPEAVAEAHERAEHLAAKKVGSGDPRAIDHLPRPKILLGLGLTPWPGPRREPRRACPACQSRPLGESEYCLVCDRWGLDALLQVPRRSPRRDQTNPISRRDKTNPISRTTSEKARANRKARHRKKLQAKIEADKATRKAASTGRPDSSGHQGSSPPGAGNPARRSAAR